VGTFTGYIVATDANGEPLRGVTVEALEVTEFTPASPNAQDHIYNPNGIQNVNDFIPITISCP